MSDGMSDGYRAAEDAAARRAGIEQFLIFLDGNPTQAPQGTELHRLRGIFPDAVFANVPAMTDGKEEERLCEERRVAFLEKIIRADVGSWKLLLDDLGCDSDSWRLLGEVLARSPFKNHLLARVNTGGATDRLEILDVGQTLNDTGTPKEAHFVLIPKPESLIVVSRT